MKFKPKPPSPPPHPTPPLPTRDPSRRTYHVPSTAHRHFAEATRLIVQGPVITGREGAAPLTAVLRDVQTNLGFTFIAELGDYLRQRGIDLSEAYHEFPMARHYLIQVRTDDVHRVIGRLYRRFGDPSRDDFIDVIEPEYTLSVSSSASLPVISSSVPGTAFDLYAQGASHTAYLADLNISSAHNSGWRGSGIKIAVIDTGVAPARQVAQYADFITPNGPQVDMHGHGTAMTSIIADIAPNADIFSLRASDLGDVGVWDLMAAIKAAVHHYKVDIINLSLGCKHLDKSCPQCGGGSNRSIVCDDDLRQIAANATTRGGPDPIIVAAVGNDGVTTGFEWPAQYDTVLAVGAVSHTGTRSSFSNIGTTKPQTHYCVCPGGDEDPTGNITEWVGQAIDSGGQTNYCIGTSPATAYASALLALLREQYKAQGPAADSAAVLRQASISADKTMPNYSAREHGMGRLVWT